MKEILKTLLWLAVIGTLAGFAYMFYEYAKINGGL